MKSIRNSSFELLRIIMILMIIIEHGNMWYIGSAYATPTQHFVKCLIASICIGAVNGFVLISGWYGIKSKISKIVDLMFMVLFCTVPILIIALTLNWLPISSITNLSGIYEYIFGGNNYWFVIDYIGLLIAAPILNKGTDHLSKKQFKSILIAGYLLICLFDFIMRSVILGAEGGYSLLWFCYLYILARYLRLYGISIFEHYNLPLLLGCIILQTILFFYGYIGLRYTNPLILIEAICLISIFKNRTFQNSTINYFASGCLMAYLLHMQPIFVPYIAKFLVNQYHTWGCWWYLLELLGWSIILLILGTLLNSIQITLYAIFKKIIKCSNLTLLNLR